jgi:hypothetical protein
VASRVGELFARNGGVATTGELTAIGLSQAKIRRFVRDGLLVPQRRGVYSLRRRAATLDGDIARVHALSLAAALARTNADCVGSHYTAATIHGLKLLNDAPSNQVTITHPREGSGSRTGRRGIRIHVADVPAQQRVVRYGVPVTNVARTIIDMARTGSFIEAVVVADAGLHAGKVTKAELERTLVACARWPGLRRAREAVAFCDERSESVLESAARVIMHEHGLPPPQLQVWIQDGYGARIGRVDFFWPQYRTIGEADGKMKYEDSAAARRQLERDSKLRQAGYELVHFGWQGVFYDTDLVIGEFRGAFERGKG